jgi:holo-[acyl-carrier protein] synthase
VIGIDVVDIERLRTVLERSPGLRARYFTEAERAHCSGFEDPVLHLAGAFAAKEAVIKAVGAAPAAASAHRVEIRHASSGAPTARFDGRSIPVSISHDGGVAVAVAFVTVVD